MKLGRVVGTVVSTINAPAFDGRTLLLCDLLDPSGHPSGGYQIAVDSVGAGAGEMVLLLDEGNSARQVLRAPGAPIRTVVVGIVDAVLEGAAVEGIRRSPEASPTPAAPKASRATPGERHATAPRSRRR